MATENQHIVQYIEPEKPDSPVTIDYRGRRVAMCYVFEHELKTIGSANNKTSVDVGFFGASIGGAIGFGSSVATVVFTNPFLYATFWALFVLSLCSTLFFFIRFLIAKRESAEEINRILNESKNREA